MAEAASAPLFPGRVFAHALSLGGDCEPAHSLRLHGRRTVNSLFDWLVTPLDAISAILADEGVRLGTRFVTAHEGTSVRCSVYDVLYHHEFPRDAHRQVVFDVEAISTCRAKMLHKLSTFIEICEGGGPLLFIRLGMETNLAWDRLGPHGGPPRNSDLNGLAGALATRFPKLNFGLLLLTLADGPSVQVDDPLDERVRILPVSRCESGEEGGWLLSDAAWADLLAHIDFSTAPDGDRSLGERLQWSGEADADRQSPPTSEACGAREETDVETLSRLEALLRGGPAPSEADGDGARSSDLAWAVLRRKGLSPRLRQAAAKLLSGDEWREEALAALKCAAAEAPDLPEIALEIAVVLEALDRRDEALDWMRREVKANPLHPPSYKRLLRLEYACGEVEPAFKTLGVMLEHGLEPLPQAHDYGLRLWRKGQAHMAVRVFELAYTQGYRARSFIGDYLDLLTGEARYAEVLSRIEELEREDATAPAWSIQAGRAKLSLHYRRDVEIELASHRSASPAWLDAEALLAAIASAVRSRRPFSFVRVGDGEARFLVATQHDRRGPATYTEAAAIVEVVWRNWFGEAFEAANPSALATLAATYTEAIRCADVIGASDPTRLRQDTGHYGYLALQEGWLRDVCAERPRMRWTSALTPRDLHAVSPYLADLLRGQDVVGVISPHPGLAEALRSHLAIGRVVSWTIPAEGRLPTVADTRASGRHYPTIYTRILEELVVPRPGCIFLVAGGLLGKIYCNRIKALGGIALDIGSLADAWMGFQTRPGQFQNIRPLPTPQTPDEPAILDPGKTTYACLSIGKTSSMALAAALREAGLPDVAHIHYLGPRATAMKRLTPEPMLDLALSIAERLDDPQHVFCMVASVRDPIARAVSQAFYNAAEVLARTGEDIVRDANAFVAWYERKFIQELTTEWFDDSYKATFGFDFREHPFDHLRSSLRFASPRLKLVVLRVEDDTVAKEAELGWLLDRERVPLPLVNDAASREHAAPYKAFLQDFVAPRSWLERYYDTEAIRHFYTEKERAGFRARWSSRGRGAR